MITMPFIFHFYHYFSHVLNILLCFIPESCHWGIHFLICKLHIRWIMVQDDLWLQEQLPCWHHYRSELIEASLSFWRVFLKLILGKCMCLILSRWRKRRNKEKEKRNKQWFLIYLSLLCWPFCICLCLPSS